MAHRLEVRVHPIGVQHSQPVPDARPETFTAACRCGKVALEATGLPIVHISCYCDDCQIAADIIDGLENGCSGQEADGGTPNVLYRRDRVRFTRGEELLEGHRVRDKTHTVRLVASCCNTAITQTHENWWPHRGIKTHLFEAVPVPLEVRCFTKFAPRPDDIPRDVKVSRGPSARLAWRIAKAALAVRGRR
jgi:hypothetical protein